MQTHDDELTPAHALPASPMPWARLIGVGSSAVLGVVDIYDRVVVGHVRNRDASVALDDERISSAHCSIYRDDRERATLMDTSDDGTTFWNHSRMGRNSTRILQHADSIILLLPNGPKSFGFMFVDLRTECSPAAAPLPPPQGQPEPPTPPPPPQPAERPSGLALAIAADDAQREFDREQAQQLRHMTAGVGRHATYSSSSSEFEAAFDLGAEIGRGAFSTVQTVISRADGREYAAKLMAKSRLASESGDHAPRRLRDEIRALSALHHPNVVVLHSIFETPDDLYLVMDKAAGGELFDRIVSCGTFSEMHAQAVMRQVPSLLTPLRVCQPDSPSPQPTPFTPLSSPRAP